MIDVIVQWATILSPIIAVGLAWWTVRSSSKDTAKKIDAIEQSTNREIERLKQISRLQIEIPIVQLQKELWDAQQHQQMINNQLSNLEVSNSTMYAMAYGHDALQRREEKCQTLKSERSFYFERQQAIKKYLSQLEEIKKKMEE